MADDGSAELELQNKASETTKKAPPLPQEITREWVNEAIEAGAIEVDGREVFVQEFDPQESPVWLLDHYGFSVPGPGEEGYFYHGTSIEGAASIIKNGLFGEPEKPTVSTRLDNQAKTTARDRESKLGVGAVVVFKTNWEEVKIQGTGFPEAIGSPASVYTGPREELPIPEHLKNAPELRWLPPGKAIGIFTVSQERKP